MSNESLLEAIAEAVVGGDKISAAAATKAALEAGVKPLAIMQVGVTKGMVAIGDKFNKFEAFLPELMLAADAGNACFALVLPLLKGGEASEATRGKVVLGTSVGDLHDIGKNLVGAVLAASGFEVFDLGVDVPALDFVKKAEEVGANIIGMSSLLTTSLPYQKDVIEYLNDMGLREKYYVIVGGGPLTPEFTRKIKADGYARLATEAVELCNQLVDSPVKAPLPEPIIIGDLNKD